ncbi:MAG: ABC transporter permease [Candidatus Tectomicrobia bacterium]|uniref:ABC transporter permease n=1 Tax=Tectimicrobiota bacterium TaxID=2528274 RepID=A0A932I1A7_UNCTE|nr:ABC transporter permease [Candidatus Tectomicrobia bacterium]
MTTETKPLAAAKAKEAEAESTGLWIQEPRIYIRALSLLAVVGGWEALGWTGVIRPSVFSYPSAIVSAFFALLFSGEMLTAAYESSQILGAGLAMAIPTGIVIGVLMGRSKNFEYAVDTFVYALYATPVVALAFPIAMVLGVDFAGKTTIVVFFAIMPVIVNVYHGVRNVDPMLLEVTRSFCSSEWQRWRDLIFPSVVPYLVAGLGLASGRALVGMVVAEFLMSISGLGALSQDYVGNLEMDKGLAPVVFLMIVGIVLTKLVNFFEGRFASWRTGSRH